jgi:hypothetical protein
MNEYLNALVHEIFDLNQEAKRVRGIDLPQSLNPPATAAEIEALERHLGVRLPPSYRDLLEICNGWQGFAANVQLLSTDQHIHGEYADYVRQWKEEQWAAGEPVPVKALIFGIALHTNQARLFDTETANETGEMEAVWWENEELHRYSDLIDMLEQYRDLLKLRIARAISKNS